MRMGSVLHVSEVAQRCRYRLEIPHQPQAGKQTQAVVGEIDFPPAKALTSRTREVMMIVVPAFADSEHCQQPVVAAVFAGVKPADAPAMGQRIDRYSGKIGRASCGERV